MGTLANSTERGMRKALQDVDRNAQTGMKGVIHEIAAIDVLDVNVIRVAPSDWPCIHEPERIATVLETPMVIITSVHVEAVPSAKTSVVMGVRNTAMGGNAAVAMHGL